MTRKQYIEQLKITPINNKVVDLIKNAYGQELPVELQQMVSFSQESIFFDDEYRTLSIEEILEAQTDLHVDFEGQSIVPVADCGENDFIVYHINDKIWSKYNIIDGISYKRRLQFKEVFEQ